MFPILPRMSQILFNDHMKWLKMSCFSYHHCIIGKRDLSRAGFINLLKCNLYVLGTYKLFVSSL